MVVCVCSQSPSQEGLQGVGREQEDGDGCRHGECGQDTEHATQQRQIPLTTGQYIPHTHTPSKPRNLRLYRLMRASVNVGCIFLGAPQRLVRRGLKNIFSLWSPNNYPVNFIFENILPTREMFCSRHKRGWGLCSLRHSSLLPLRETERAPASQT